MPIMQIKLDEAKMKITLKSIGLLGKKAKESAKKELGASAIDMLGESAKTLRKNNSIATSFLINPIVGNKTTLLILIHEFIRIFADISILQQSGVSLLTAYGLQLITSFGTIIGCISVLYAIKLLDIVDNNRWLYFASFAFAQQYLPYKNILQDR